MTHSARDRWQGKLVLVTGGSSGFGTYIAQAFGRRGAKVLVNGRGEVRLNEAIQRLREEGCDAHAYAAHVR